MSAPCVERFPGVVAVVCPAVKTAAVKPRDETGFRIGGKTPWRHVAVTLGLPCYRVSPKRGHLMEGLEGIVVHDHGKPYYPREGVLHALDNAPHLRALKARPRSRKNRGRCEGNAACAAPAL
jgi:transposase